MKPWTLLGLATLALTACQSTPHGTETVELTVTRVVVPQHVGASDDLPVVITVTLGGCQTFKGFAVQERTASTLKLLAQGTSPSGKNVVCPAIIGSAEKTYIDPGSPARTSPFEVFVNGQSYGSVGVE
ncbi:hypothetical protein [Deinococcus alpinitundrae]|uniref:hypothetical protein n=1 Tax=Deinococcus alpinitundrae TaxID=468913 RepID=UPI00137B53AD|nr:hypothetical protein [Deinococcus alpinitundrae]